MTYPTIQLTRPWRLSDDNPNEWLWTNRAQRRHDLSDWLEVSVPTSVQAALLRAGRIPHPYRDLNSRAAEWVEHRDWVFGLDFSPVPQFPAAGGRAFLEFESVDDSCLVYLNGVLAGRHEGPGAPFALEVGPLLREGENQLLVVVTAPHHEHPQTGWTEHTRSLKGRMGYGWDFAPRLVRTGILGSVSLRYTGPHRLRDLWVRSDLASDLRSARLSIQVTADGPAGAAVRFTVMNGRREVASASAISGADGVARS